MFIPRSAHFARRLQAAVMKQTQTTTDSHSDEVRQIVPQAGKLQNTSFRFEQIENYQNAIWPERLFEFQDYFTERQVMQSGYRRDNIKTARRKNFSHDIAAAIFNIRKWR